MYDYIRGILVEKTPASATVEAAGVGYAVMISLSTYEALPETGAEIKLFTHLSIREDAHKLFGFSSSEERKLFRQLIAVNMVGPKIALNILSNITVSKLVNAINSGDSSRLKSISGIGPKMAQRLIVELKGKFDSGEFSGTGASGTGSSKKSLTDKNERQDAYSALVSLGYSDKQVIKALERVETTIAPEAPVEEWIRMSLQVI
jgi:holliday junction DNA helicase RuvA